MMRCTTRSLQTRKLTPYVVSSLPRFGSLGASMCEEKTHSGQITVGADEKLVKVPPAASGQSIHQPHGGTWAAKKKKTSAWMNGTKKRGEKDRWEGGGVLNCCLP